MAEQEKERRLSRRLGLQTLYMIVGNLYTLLVGLPLQILVSRVLGAHGLGLFGLFEAGVNIIRPVLGFGIAQVTIRFIPAHLERREYTSIRRLVIYGGFILFGAGVAVSLLVFLLLPMLAEFWPQIAENYAAAVMMIFMIPLGLLTAFFQQTLRGFHDIRYMVFGSSVVRLTVKAIVTVAVFAVGWGLAGYVFAVVASTVFAVAWMLFGVWRKIRALPKNADTSLADYRKEWYRYGAWNYGASLLNNGMGGTSLDRILLGIFAGIGPVGVLLIIRQLQNLPVIFHQMLLVVGAPMMSAAHARGDAKERQHLYTLTTDWVVRASLPLIFFLFIFAKPALGVFGPEFSEEGWLALQILVVAQLVTVATGPSGNIALMSGLEKEVIRFSVVIKIARTVLFLILIPLFGLVGAAIATAIAAVWSSLYTVALIRRGFDMNWWHPRYRQWALPALACLAVAFGVEFLDLAKGTVILCVVLVAMYGAFLAVMVVQGLNADDRDLLNHLKERLLAKRGS